MQHESLPVSDLVINWHVTEACNFRCAYCYAQWERPDNKEVIRDTAATQALLHTLRDAFHGNRSRTRLNFAGGEPLLFDRQVLAAMRFALDLDFEVSLITNASRMTRPLVADLAPMLKVLGISVDAANDTHNAAIGRADTSGRTTPVDALPDLIGLARQLNPDLQLKINTVVNAVNWQLDMAPLIEKLAPDQWKVLRMLPSTTRQLEVTETQFRHYIEKHAHLKSIMRVEDNDAMVESYIMVDPHGRFFQNRHDTLGYAYSPPMLGVGARDAFKTIQWSADKFMARYEPPSAG